MRAHRFEATQVLPGTPAEVFPFFAEARNLDAITPPWLRFRIIPPIPTELREGALIDYRLRLRGVPIRWRTRIRRWDPPLGFIDEQIEGPYRSWVHTHTFEPTENGTRCHDLVEYSHAGGRIVHRLLVRPEIERIFAYRRARLSELFGAVPA